MKYNPAAYSSNAGPIASARAPRARVRAARVVGLFERQVPHHRVPRRRRGANGRGLRAHRRARRLTALSVWWLQEGSGGRFNPGTPAGSDSVVGYRIIDPGVRGPWKLVKLEVEKRFMILQSMDSNRGNGFKRPPGGLDRAAPAVLLARSHRLARGLRLRGRRLQRRSNAKSRARPAANPLPVHWQVSELESGQQGTRSPEGGMDRTCLQTSL